jgi:hypothetical protein
LLTAFILAGFAGVVVVFTACYFFSGAFVSGFDFVLASSVFKSSYSAI